MRIVSTAPSLTECVFAIGAGETLVGRTDVCDFPAAAVHVPVTGKFAQPFLEATLATEPTHIIETAWVDADMRQRFEEAGVPVVHVPCVHAADIPAALRQLGALTGHEAQAEKEARHLQEGISQAYARATASMRQPRVLVLVDPAAPITVGPQTFISEMVSLSGCTNIAEKATADYYHISLEWLLVHEPDLILCLFHFGDSQPCTLAALFSSRPGWKDLRAVRENKVRTVPDLDSVCRPGPRILQGLEELKATLH